MFRSGPGESALWHTPTLFFVSSDVSANQILSLIRKRRGRLGMVQMWHKRGVTQIHYVSFTCLQRKCLKMGGGFPNKQTNLVGTERPSGFLQRSHLNAVGLVICWRPTCNPGAFEKKK